MVVPVHNGERFLRACWDTLCQQTLPPREVVFVDDGSTDGTLDLLRSLSEHHASVRVLTQSSEGPAAARNAGIRAATSNLLAFLDVDDEWPAATLQRASECFLRYPEVSVVAGLVQMRWKDAAPPADSPLRRPHRRVNLGAHTFRAQVFSRFGLFDPSLTYGEDVEYLARIKQAQVRFHYLEEVTLYYQQHGGNMTTGRGVHELGLFQALSRSFRRGQTVG